jgi:outer membrane protein
MDLSPATPLTLPAVDAGVQPDTQFEDSVEDLIEQVRASHPSVVAAQAQLDAATAKVSQTRAQGLPSLSLVVQSTWSNQPTSLGLGASQYPASARQWYIGLQLTIPFFEGFGRAYQVHGAQAQVEQRRAELDGAQQQAGLDVWTAWQTLQTTTDTLRHDGALLDIAQRSYAAAGHRYQAGVGSIVELLDAQTMLAHAGQQHIQSLTDWRAARLRLAGTLGRLDFDAAAQR